MSTEPLMSANKIRKEAAKAIMQPAEDVLKKFEPLLSRFPAETLVLHFACWLEKKYFETKDTFFYANFLTYRHVLQKCLERCTCVETKSLSELNNLADQYFKKIALNKDLDKDTTGLFDATLNWLITDAEAEVYRQWGKISDGNSVISPECLLQDESLREKKSFLYHTYEFELPHISDEVPLYNKIMMTNKTNSGKMCAWHIWTGDRFLTRACGDKILAEVENKRSWKPLNAVIVLLAAYYGYESKFILPCFEAKQHSRGDVFDSRGLSSLLMAFDPRPLDAFLKISKEFLYKQGMSIPDRDINAIFSDFTADIHTSTEFSIGEEFLLLRNDSCFLFMPRLFFHPDFILTTIYDLIFQKSEQSLSTYFEEWIGSLFEDTQFKVRCRYPIGNDRSLGDIDIIAYKENTLVVIQAKLTKIRHLINNIFWLPEKFEKGGEQLNTALEWLKKPENQTKVAKDLCIARPFKELRIVPLIVSNSLEYDHKYFGGHLKISAFELEAAVLNLHPGTIWKLNQEYQKYIVAAKNMASNTSAGQKTIPVPSPNEIGKFQLYPETRGKRFNTADETIRCIEEQRLWKLAVSEDLPRTPIPT